MNDDEYMIFIYLCVNLSFCIFCWTKCCH